MPYHEVHHLDLDRSDPMNEEHFERKDRLFDICARLHSWNHWNSERRATLPSYLLSKIGIPRPPKKASSEEVEFLLEQVLPATVHTRCFISDFDAQRSDAVSRNRPVVIKNALLGELQKYFYNKPNEVSLRWIHVPLEFGSVLSDLVASFDPRIDQRRTEYGIPLTPAPEFAHVPSFETIEAMSPRQLDLMWLQVTALMYAHTDERTTKLFNHLLPWLDDDELGIWRLRRWAMLGYSPEHPPPWLLDAYRALLPYQFGTERYREYRRKGNVASMSEVRGLKSLSIPGGICAGSMTFFARPDGFLLTFSSKVITKEFPCHGSIETIMPDQAFFRELFKEPDIGLNIGNVPITIEWLMTYLASRLNSSFAPIFGSMLSLQTNYSEAVRKLSSRRATTARGDKAKKLVLSYVRCMDELSALQGFYEQKDQYLEQLRNELSKQNEGLAPSDYDDSIQGKKVLLDDMISRCDAALARIRRDHGKYPQMLRDLKSALDVVFQLRTIEQNEAALIAESNNRAIMVFTVITIIFLPLSFFTSYFGMNLKDISSTDHDQRYFWAVCGSSTAIIIVLTMVFGFRAHIHEFVWTSRVWARPAEEDADEGDDWMPAIHTVSKRVERRKSRSNSRADTSLFTMLRLWCIGDVS